MLLKIKFNVIYLKQIKFKYQLSKKVIYPNKKILY